MTENNLNDETNENLNYPVQTVKVVTEMPEDGEIRKNLQDINETDGQPASC